MQIFDPEMARRLTMALRRLGLRAGDRPAPAAAPEPVPAPQAAQLRAAYAELLRSGSNLELDWLWLAAQLADPAERRNALERALAINPQSDAARRELARLAPPVAPSSQSCPA